MTSVRTRVAAVLLVLLLPMVLLRAACFRWLPSWPEVVLYCLLSVPSLVFYFGMSYCADIPLTIIVGHNAALAVDPLEIADQVHPEIPAWVIAV